MAATVIPVSPDLADQEMIVDLGDALYRLRLRWNRRGEFWTATIETDGGDLLLAGRVLRTDWDALLQFADRALPQGHLVPLDTGQTRAEPGRRDLGDRLALGFDAA